MDLEDTLRTYRLFSGSYDLLFGPVFHPGRKEAVRIANDRPMQRILEVGGETMQKGSTRNMIFTCATIVSYASHFMTLLPGDIIPTGTPAGVGLGRKRFLKPGEEMHLAVTGLGEQRQRVLAWG